MNDQEIDIEPPRYDVLEVSGVSTINRLFQCSSSQGENSAELTLRDTQYDTIVPVTIVEVLLEHDPMKGAVFFTGKLDTGFTINGYAWPIAAPDGVAGSATINP